MADPRPEPDLYEEDFYAWTQRQAAALRAGAAGSNVIEWARVAEEIEDLGSAERNSVRGHLLQIIVHLHKLRSSHALQPRAKWRAEIRTHRLAVADRLSASLRRAVEDDLDRLHVRGAREAQQSLDDYERDARVDAGRRWSFAALMGERDDPLELDRLEG